MSSFMQFDCAGTFRSSDDGAINSGILAFLSSAVCYCMTIRAKRKIKMVESMSLSTSRYGDYPEEEDDTSYIPDCSVQPPASYTSDCSSAPVPQRRSQVYDPHSDIWGHLSGKKVLHRQKSSFDIAKVALNLSSEICIEDSDESHFEVRNHHGVHLPDRLVLIRHGESLGNVNSDLYGEVPDNAMPLTDFGWEQAYAAGRVLKDEILKDLQEGDCSRVHFVVSPYVRTVETFNGIVSAWSDPRKAGKKEDGEAPTTRAERMRAWYEDLASMGISWHEDPRLREQDFGNYQDPDTIKQCKSERHAFGPFYYRYPDGESASDVYDRASTFLESLFRSFRSDPGRVYVLVTHGIAIRVLLCRYFRYSVDQYHKLANPENCECVVLKKDGRSLDLEGRYALTIEERVVKRGNREDDTAGDLLTEKRVVGHEFHTSLRQLPSCLIQTRKIRMCPEDDIEAKEDMDGSYVSV